MNKYLLTLLALLWGIAATAQTYIYKGDHNMMADDIAFTIENNIVYKGRKTGFSEPILSFKDNKLYRYQERNLIDEPVLTIDKNKILMLDGIRSNVVYTIDGNKIRQGDGTFLSNIVLFTIESDKIKLGDNFSNRNILYTIKGTYTLQQIACILFAGSLGY